MTLSKEEEDKLRGQWKKDAQGLVKFLPNINSAIVDGFSDYWIAKMKEALEKRKEVLIKKIEKSRSFVGWTHTVGSHSDDRGGDSDILCTCMNEEIEIKLDVYDNIIKLITSEDNG